MGRLVHLWKASDTDESATYRYGPSKDQSGLLSVSKKERTVAILEPVPGIGEEEEMFLFRSLAVAKLQMLSSRESFPDETYIAT